MSSKFIKYAAIGTACGLLLSGLEGYMNTPRTMEALNVATLATPFLDQCTDIRTVLEKLVPYAEYDLETWNILVQQAESLCEIWVAASDNTRHVQTSLPLYGHRIHNEMKRTFMEFIRFVTPKLRAKPRLQVMLPSLQDELLERMEDYVYNIQMAIGDSMLYQK